MTTCAEDVSGLLKEAIQGFYVAIDKSNKSYYDHCCFYETPKFKNLLEIDTHDIGEDGKPYIKVVNNRIEKAFAVTLDTIVYHSKDGSMESLIRALQTDIFNRVYGVTRIVGYYSRTTNWNKSKMSELGDRHAGNYQVTERPKTI